jgi:hypothetical protein
MISHAKALTKSERIFFVRSTSHLEDANVLLHLVVGDKPVIAPMLRTYATMRYGRKMVKDNSRWKRSVDTPVSFYKASLSKGNVSGIAEKFLSGVNFITVDPESKFWRPLEEDFSFKLDRMIP